MLFNQAMQRKAKVSPQKVFSEMWSRGPGHFGGLESREPKKNCLKMSDSLYMCHFYVTIFRKCENLQKYFGRQISCEMLLANYIVANCLYGIVNYLYT